MKFLKFMYVCVLAGEILQQFLCEEEKFCSEKEKFGERDYYY